MSLFAIDNFPDHFHDLSDALALAAIQQVIIGKLPGFFLILQTVIMTWSIQSNQFTAGVRVNLVQIT
jgi:hypothetical protein